MANKLAKLAKHYVEPQIWLEDIHSDVAHLVLFDNNFSVDRIKLLTGFSKKKKKKKKEVPYLKLHTSNEVFHLFSRKNINPIRNFYSLDEKNL